MSNLALVSNEMTMTSIELLDLINEARKHSGEGVIRRNDFHDRVSDELDGENYETFVVQNLNKTETTAYKLTKDQCLLVSMRESKAVRRKVVARLNELENKSNQPMSLEELAVVQSQALLQQKRQMDNMERSVRATQEEQQQMKAQIQQIETNTRNGVPVGYISKSKAYRKYGSGLSKEIFELALTTLNVQIQNYVHSENDHSVFTFAWKEDEIKSAIAYFIEQSDRITDKTCASRILNGKQFRFSKGEAA